MNIQKQIEKLLQDNDNGTFIIDNTDSVHALAEEMNLILCNAPSGNDTPNKFNIGDTVKVISDQAQIKKGYTGSIKHISEYNGFINYLVGGAYLRQAEIERII